MSKEGIEKLNQKLLEHYEETGITKALYYEPFENEKKETPFWNNKYRIVFCNLEPYDNNIGWKDGFHKVTAEVFEEGWKNNKTIRFSMKIGKFILDFLEGIPFTESDVKKTISSDDLLADFINCAYMNLRPTFSSTVKQNHKELEEIYSDPFYEDFLKKYLDEFKDDDIDLIYIFAGKDSCKIINKLYPELHLEFDGTPVWQLNSRNEKKYMYVSMKHPSGPNGAHFSNKYAYEILKRIKDNW